MKKYKAKINNIYNNISNNLNMDYNETIGN